MLRSRRNRGRRANRGASRPRRQALRPSQSATFPPQLCHTRPRDSHSRRYDNSSGVWIMSGRLESVLEFVRRAVVEPLGRLGVMLAGAVRALFAAAGRWRRRLVAATLLAALAYGL